MEGTVRREIMEGIRKKVNVENRQEKSELEGVQGNISKDKMDLVIKLGRIVSPERRRGSLCSTVLLIGQYIKKVYCKNVSNTKNKVM